MVITFIRFNAAQIVIIVIIIKIKVKLRRAVTTIIAD